MQPGKSHRARRSPVPEILRGEREVVRSSAQDLAEIRAVVLEETRADLRDYRPDLVQDVVARRMARRQIGSISEYARYVRRSPQEAVDLLVEIQPRPNQLFQEAATLEALRTGFSTTLWKEPRIGDRFRAWVPFCGSGEEVYSVAITVLEMLERSGQRDFIQIFGTDLNEGALQTARAGIYAEAKARELAVERHLRFFRQEGEALQVRREVRDICLFGLQNAAKDPPLMRMDLVVFRNQLGAFTDAVQGRLLERFHYSVKAGGLLVLGQSEIPESRSSLLFAPVANKRGIFLRRPTTGRLWHGEPNSPKTGFAERASAEPADAPPGEPRPTPRRGQTNPAGGQVQVLLEEQAKAIESLRTANEEIVTSNEELQVTNEELMVTREELQAANQELATLNEEMQERNRTLGRESAELRALFHNTDAAVVTVDAKLRIRRFTPRAARLFRLAAQDAGRRLTDLQPRLNIPELETLLRATAEDLTSHEREVRAEDGGVYRISIRPFRGEDDRIDGAILTAWPAGPSR